MDEIYPDSLECTLPFYQERYLEDNFDSTEFFTIQKTNVIRMQSWDMPLGGNTKDILISSFDPKTKSGQIDWAQVLDKASESR